MKNQTDLIVAIVAFVLTAGSILGMWLMKRDTVGLQPPTPVVVTPAPLPSGDVSMANALPGGGSASGAGSFGGGMGRGGRPGMGAPGMSAPGMSGPGGPGMGRGKPSFGGNAG